MAASSRRHPFLALLARHGRILLFRATKADYQALGWWDLTWGLAVTYLIDFIRSWTRPETQPFQSPTVEAILAACVWGLRFIPLIALLRPSGGSVWRTLPLQNLAF